MLEYKVIRLFSGLSCLGILYIGLVISAHLFDLDLHSSRLSERIQPFTMCADGYKLLPGIPGRNVTNYPHGEERNITRDRINNVVFLKVPKAGSTTMQNLLFRYGKRHNLNILLPKEGNYLSKTTQILPLKPPKTYNIFACHAEYSKTLFDQLIPNGSVKIGIVREPVDRMISAAYYYRDIYQVAYLTKIPKTNFIKNLINYQEKYDKKLFSQTHNLMGVYFGFPKTIKSTEKDRIDSYLQYLNCEFDLVMVVEKFDESLIIMKRYLSWSFLDIIYLKTNKHEHEPVVLNKHEEMKVRETNFLDFAIYEYFTKAFDKRLTSMGHGFVAEVEYFKQLINKVQVFCSQENLPRNSKLFVDESVWEKEFTVLGKECRMMKTDEYTFIYRITNEINQINK